MRLNPEDGSPAWESAVVLDFYRIFGGLDGQAEVQWPTPAALTDPEESGVGTTLIDASDGSIRATIGARMFGFRGTETYYGVHSARESLMAWDTNGHLLWQTPGSFGSPARIPGHFITHDPSAIMAWE